MKHILPILIYLHAGPLLAHATPEVCNKDTSAKALLAEVECHSSQQMLCKEFYSYLQTDFTQENQRNCKAESGSTVMAAAACSPLGLYAVSKTYAVLPQATQRKIVDLIPEVAKKLGTKALPILSGVGAVTSTYILADLLVESIEQDKKCFENIPQKKYTLALLKRQSDQVRQKISGLIKPDEDKSLEFSSDYLTEAYIKNVTCQTLKDLVIQQKRKLDSLIGPLIASGKISGDPRLSLNEATTNVGSVSDEDLALNSYFLKNMECLSPAKRAEILCAIGNSMMGLGSLRSFLISNEKKAVTEILNKQRNEVAKLRALQTIDFPLERQIVAEVAKTGALKVNLGGIGEVKGAVNINNLQDPRHANSNIPNLIKGDMRKMPYIDNSSVQELYCMACPGAREFFGDVTAEAFRVVKSGGTFRITSNSSAGPWVEALEKAGFQIVNKSDKAVLARKP